MIGALAAEISADFERSMLCAEAAFAPLMEPQGAQETYAAITGGFGNVLDKAMLDFTRTPERARRNATGFVSLFTQLKDSGFFDQLNEASEKVLRETGWKRD